MTVGLDPVVEAALRPVLHDLERTSPVRFRVEPYGDDWRGWPGVWLHGPSGGSTGSACDPTSGAVDRVVAFADVVWECAVEELWTLGLPAVWPVCPLHPGSHPLRPSAREGRATWCCPRTDADVTPIGELRGTP